MALPFRLSSSVSPTSCSVEIDRMAIQDLKTHPRAYVSLTELAAYWRVSRRYLYKQIQNGTLPALQFGSRSFRISVRTALAFEHSRSASANALSTAIGSKGY